MRCIKCGYSWETRSVLPYVCCPACMRKIKNEGIAVREGIKVESSLQRMKAKYDAFVKDYKSDPITYEDGEEPEPILSYEEWIKKAIQ